VASNAHFERMHQVAASNQARRRQNEENALREEVAALRPPQLNARSKKIADRTCTQPLVERCEEFRKAREQTRERALQVREERELEELTCNPEITVRAACMDRRPEDLQRWDEKRRQQLYEQQTRRLEQQQRECTFRPQILPSSEQLARRVAMQPVQERLQRQAKGHPGSGAPTTAAAGGRGGDAAKQPAASTLAGGSAGVAADVPAGAGPHLSFEDFMQSQARSASPRKPRPEAVPARPSSAGALAKPRPSVAAEARIPEAEVLRPGLFSAWTAGTAAEEPLWGEATQPLTARAPATRPSAGGTPTRPATARSTVSLATPEGRTTAWPRSAAAMGGGRGSNYVEYSPDLENVLLMTGLRA